MAYSDFEPTFHNILWNSNVEGLRFLLDLLGVKKPGTKKAEFVQAVERAYDGKGLMAIWSSLEPLEQLAVAEACHSPALRHDTQKFLAKYKSAPEFYRIPESEQRYSYHYHNKAEFASRLNLLLFPEPRSRLRFVPKDLAERLREFVPPPATASIRPLTEPAPEDGLVVRRTESESVADLTALLRLADAGNLMVSAKTGHPSSATCTKITELLRGGDYFPPDEKEKKRPGDYYQEKPIGPIKTFAWSLLLGNAGLLTSSGSKSKLSPSGLKALRQHPHEVIQRLWTKWLGNSTHDEFNRVDTIKGQSSKGHMTAKPPRRKIIVDTLRECPVGQWIETGEFSDFLRAQGRTFTITNDPWKLYIEDPNYGNMGYDGYGKWKHLEFRYILCFLFEYAATLGLVDVAYVHPTGALDDFRSMWGTDDLAWLSRYDGLRAFRITPLGEFCLGLCESYQPAKESGQSSLRLSVQTNLSVRILSGQPDPSETLLLEAWAEPTEPGVWKLTPARAVASIERGQSSADFAAFLAQCDDQPLPDQVEGFLRNCQSDGTAITSRGEARIYDCRDGKTADLVCTQKELINFCFRFGAKSIVVPEAQEAKFRRVVREMNLGIV